MEKKHVKKFEYEHGTEFVHYDELPTQEVWEKVCNIIWSGYEKQKIDLAESISKN